MANNFIVIGNQTLPPASRMAITPVPQYAEHVSLNGIVSRDVRATDPLYLISLSWEALTPAEKFTLDLAWETLVIATPSTNTDFTGVDSAFYQVLPDEKSNEYNYTGYSGIKSGYGLMVLFDATITLRAIRVFV